MRLVVEFWVGIKWSIRVETSCMDGCSESNVGVISRSGSSVWIEGAFEVITVVFGKGSP
jgi:hypothetical protein